MLGRCQGVLKDGAVLGITFRFYLLGWKLQKSNIFPAVIKTVFRATYCQNFEIQITHPNQNATFRKPHLDCIQLFIKSFLPPL